MDVLIIGFKIVLEMSPLVSNKSLFVGAADVLVQWYSLGFLFLSSHVSYFGSKKVFRCRALTEIQFTWHVSCRIL